MKTKTAIVLATVALVSFIAVAFAANWYYSTYTPDRTVSAWIVALTDPGAYVQYSNVTLTGTVTLGGAAQPGVFVYLYKSVNGGADVQIPDSPVLTNGAGIYSLQYNVTEANGQSLRFRAGINQ